VILPREGHGWTERQHHTDVWEHVRGWISRYL
jgi:dipeptidyl aminopeptidase/acylaminoacyl peptidase